MASIDPARELSIRAIAHNVGYKFGPFPGTDEDQEQLKRVERYALKLALLFEDARIDPRARPPQSLYELADAGVAMWRATSGPRP